MIVGVTGLMRHGKDEVARALTNDESLGFVRMALADPLKTDMLTLNPYIGNGKRLLETVKAIGWDTAKDAYPEVRRILQVYGTEVVRHGFGDTVWPERLLCRSAQLRDAGWHIVVPDVRFKEEVSVPPLDLLIYVYRPFSVKADCTATSHSSETNITSVLLEARDANIPILPIHNVGTVEDLHEAVLTAVRPYL